MGLDRFASPNVLESAVRVANLSLLPGLLGKQTKRPLAVAAGEDLLIDLKNRAKIVQFETDPLFLTSNHYYLNFNDDRIAGGFTRPK